MNILDIFLNIVLPFGILCIAVWLVWVLLNSEFQG